MVPINPKFVIRGLNIPPKSGAHGVQRGDLTVNKSIPTLIGTFGRSEKTISTLLGTIRRGSKLIWALAATVGRGARVRRAALEGSEGTD
jgi:hypothetical protein